MIIFIYLYISSNLISVSSLVRNDYRTAARGLPNGRGSGAGWVFYLPEAIPLGNRVLGGFGPTPPKVPKRGKKVKNWGKVL